MKTGMAIRSLIFRHEDADVSNALDMLSCEKMLSKLRTEATDCGTGARSLTETCQLG